MALSSERNKLFKFILGINLFISVLFEFVDVVLGEVLEYLLC